VERVARVIEDAAKIRTDPFSDRPEIINVDDVARAALAAAEPPEPTDKQADRIANLCDISLQDSLTTRANYPGVDFYDGRAFAKSLAGNGYRVVPINTIAAADTIAAQAARIEALEEALTALVDETVDYMKINHLGDPEQKHNIKLARRALGDQDD